MADAFHAPLRYVRGNHDVGPAWAHTERKLLPEPMRDGEIDQRGDRLRLMGFSGSPRYNQRGMQVSAIGMWAKVVSSWPRARRARADHRRHPCAAARRERRRRPRASRLPAFRWLVDRIAPPLWLHGHTALVRRGIDDRMAAHNGTTFYNCTGATLVELMPPDSPEPCHA